MIDRFARACLVLALGFVLLANACPIERLLPNLVADGVARLSVANIGLLVLALQDIEPPSPECDLFSFASSPNATVSGNPLTFGSVTWTYEDCIFFFPPDTPVFTQELSEPATPASTNRPELRRVQVGTLSGRVRLSGQKTARGYLTGDTDLLVIPEGSESLTFRFSSMKPDHLKGQLTGQEKSLDMQSGELSFDLSVHLAADKAFQLCRVPMGNITVSNVRYNIDRNPKGSLLSIPGLFNSFEVPVLASNFSAQRGFYAGQTNTLLGQITVWDTTQRVPSDGLGLEPEFSPSAYQESIAKTPELQLPATGHCPVERFVALNTARLLIKNMGVVAQQIAMDTSCGFGSSGVLRNPLRVVGFPPERGLMEFGAGLAPNSACTIGAPGQSDELGRSCQDVASFTSGFVSVRATATLLGEREHYCIIPVAFCYPSISPRTPNDVLLRVTNATFSDFSAYDLEPGADKPRARLLLEEGTASATVQPILTGTQSDPCVFEAPTPVGLFSNVRYQNTRGVLELNLRENPGDPNQVLSFDVNIERAALNAQNGFYQGQGNSIDGEIVLNGKTYTLRKADGSALALDPTYTQQSFDEAYACEAISELVPPGAWNPNVGACALGL